MRYPFIIISIGLILIMAGCGDRPTPPDQSIRGADISQPIPAEVRKLVDTYAPPDNGLPSGAGLSYLDPIPSELTDNCDVYAITFLWGDLFNAGSPATDTTDWSGTLGINADGVVHVRYMIDFEPGQDSVLIHNNPTFAAWLSYTSQDFDGLSFLVFLPRDVVYFAPPVLTFETVPITLQFNFTQLIRLDAFYQVDNTNGVAVHSRKIWNNVCPGGTMEGRWIKDAYDPDQGMFHGLWKDRWGNPVGYMSCIFWMDEDGNREFTGSLSGYDTDEVMAEIKGVWYFDDPLLCPVCGDDHGFFMGRYAYLNNGGSGKLRGEFGYPPSPADTDLPFHGTWRDDCPYITPSDLQSAAD